MAKVYLDSGDTFTLGSGATVFGAGGTEKVLVGSGVSGVVVDQNVERVDLAAASSGYTYQQAGNTLQVYSGATLIASIPLQGDADGTIVAFTNGSVSAKLTAGVMTLGGATVPSAAPGAVTPTTINAGDVSGVPPTGPSFSVAGAASVTEGASATFTVSLSAAQSSSKTVTYTLEGTGGAVLGTDTGASTPAGNTGTLTFAAGEVSKTVVVPFTFDTTAETGEGVKLTLSAPSSGISLGTASATTAIADPTPPTFTLTSNAVAGAANEEGSTITYTITPSGVTDKAYTFTLSTIGDTVGGVATAATAADFSPASQTVTFAAGSSTAMTVTQTIVNDGLTEGLEGYKTSLLDSTFAVVSSKTGLITDPTSGTGSGTTYTLTTALDNIPGTNGNDTILGDFTATATLNAGDQIAGGLGTDTLKMFGTYAAGNMPLTISGLENVVLAVAADADLNWTAWPKAVTGIEKFEILDATLINGKTITTTAGQALSLATGASSSVTAGTVTWAGSATDSALSLTLNGYQGIAGGTPAALTITGAAATTLNIASTGGTNKVATLTGPTTVTSHVITGDKALTYVTAAADSAALNSINASANSGGVNVNISAALTKAGFTFTGGSGNDTIKFANDEFGTLTAGTQLNGSGGSGDKIGLLDTALTAAETAKINAATGFEVLGLNAAITLDASTLTSIKQFSVDTTALTQTINNMATGSTVTVNAAAPTSLTLAGATGVSDVTIALGTSSSTGNIAVGTLVTTGLTSIALSSNGTGTHTNTITTLTNSDNSNFTVTGSQQLTMTLSAGTAIGSKVDGSAMTGKLIVTGSSGAAFNDILIGGSAADTIGGLKGADKMTGNGGADTFTFASAAGDNANGASFGTFDEITDFTTAVDKLQFSGVVDVVSGQQAAVQTAVTALAAGSTAAQIATAMATANTTNLGVSFAVFEGNTYVLFETAGASTGVVADDVFIKLTGVTTAPTFAADVIA